MAGKVLALLLATAILLTPRGGAALDNGVGQRPQLGFNSWNAWGCAVNETVLRSTMDAFVTLGLRDAGFEYVSTDDCWQSGCRIGQPGCTLHKRLGRHPNGTVIPNPDKFPSGMKALADYAHSKRLKFGLYSSNSERTCGGHAGSQGFEQIDAASYASWGVDLLKYDNCGGEATNGPPEHGYAVMRDALAQCHWAPHPLFSL